MVKLTILIRCTISVHVHCLFNSRIRNTAFGKAQSRPVIMSYRRRILILKLTTPVFLAAYQIGIQERLDEYEMGVPLGITSGTIVRRGNRHVVHSCASFKGDSGGAIVISNGKVIGLHMAAVNETKELLDVTSVDFGSVAVVEASFSNKPLAANLYMPISDSSANSGKGFPYPVWPY